MKYLTHPIVVIDVETTGFSYTDEVIEIGAVFVDEFGRIRSEFDGLIRNEHPIKFSGKIALSVNQISEEQLAEADSLENIRLEFINWWQALPNQESLKAIAFNTRFDKRMLENSGIHLPFGKCLMDMTKDLMKHQGTILLNKNGQRKAKPSLEDACDFFGLEYTENAHRALEDARMTALVAIKVSQYYQQLLMGQGS